MRGESVWLGPLRGSVRVLMISSIAAALATWAWLAFGHFFTDGRISMYEMLRPAGRPMVQVMLATLTAALLFASIYLSDRVGAIEERPTGPFDILSLVASRLAMIAIAFIVIVMVYEVVSRYVFEKPTLWANELSLWIAGFVFLFAGLYAKQQRSHIRIYIIYDLMPRWMQKLSDCLSVALIWAFFLCLLWGGYTEAVVKFQRMETFGTAWDPPLPATIKPAILIVIGLVAVQALSNLIADWHKAPEHHSPLDEIDQTEIEQIRRAVED
ncbi:TRAP transporter small permease subunit [Rhodovulum euryhalinum]|uniref:TRAP transporter small permease protein n=1 Tax=Rhodovulum euryhalinum TaxID=35805 RepID=A0A4R2KMF2_9RHOB|nr:TRAP transporter small permease [Rhodovulum euryhalinum]TCO71929.1 TRAP-type mannitol/chloroaromatic compound transport system permease small subunit [Rhodovulum euryhalinum]